MLVAKLLKLSRPRFWSYLAGPFLIAYTAGMPTLLLSLQHNASFISFFFLIFGNILLYAIEPLHLDMITHGSKNKKKHF